MVKFGVSIKDQNTDVSILGDTIKEVIENLKKLQKLKINSDEFLGFDIKLPKSVLERIHSMEYSERVLMLLYFAEKEMTRIELRQRNSILKIREGWWSGSNFSRDLNKKKNEGFISESNDPKPKYKITQKGIRYVKKIMQWDGENHDAGKN